MAYPGCSSTATRCDSCEAALAASFLCSPCDTAIHGVGATARHPLCDVCEQAIACRAESAALCRACDSDVHSANPLAHRHERIPIVPSYAAGCVEDETGMGWWLLLDPDKKLSDELGSTEYKSRGGLFDEMGLNLGSGNQKTGQLTVIEYKQHSSDGIVPVEGKNEYGAGQYPDPIFDGFPAYDMGYYPDSAKPFVYNFTAQSISQSMSMLSPVTPPRSKPCPTSTIILFQHDSQLSIEKPGF